MLEAPEESPISPMTMKLNSACIPPRLPLASWSVSSPSIKGILSEDYYLLKRFPLLSAIGQHYYFEIGYWKKIYRTVNLPLFGRFYVE
jgi:hypothetical protein